MTTTSDARKRLAEKNEQPAPASVTVPEGGWRDGDWIVTHDYGLVLRDSRTHDDHFPWGEIAGVRITRWSDGDVAAQIESGAVLDVHAPRPEPVADPQSHPHLSEAASRVVDDVDEPARCGSSAPHAPHLVSDSAFGRIGDTAHCSGKSVPPSVEQALTEDPLPVADPLPREAAQWRDQLRQAADNKCCQCTDGHHDQIGYIFGTEQDVRVPRDIARRLADLLDRLVPEGDEDTVRVLDLLALCDAFTEHYAGRDDQVAHAVRHVVRDFRALAEGAGS